MKAFYFNFLFRALTFVSLIFFPFFVNNAIAQDLPIPISELEPQFKAQLFGHDTNDLVQEMRFGNLAQLNQNNKLIGTLADNQAPTFEIAPEIKTLRVGEQKQFRFSFSDAENDSYFGGVVALNTKIELDPGRKTKKQLAQEAAVKIDVLNSGNPSVILWNITGQNPGVAIFFVSVAEIFSSTEGGIFKISSGRIKYVAYAFRIIGDNENSVAPQFINQFNDLTLKLKERINLSFAARSPENRPLTYSFLYLAYASRLIKGQFFGNNSQIKAIQPGQGVFIAFVSDGIKADIQTFVVTVEDPQAPPPIESKLKARILSSNAFVAQNKPQTVDIYGDNFSISTQVMLKTVAQTQQLPVQFISSSNLKVLLPNNVKEKSTIQLVDNNQVASIDFQPLAPVVIDVKRIRNKSKNVFRIKLLGAEISRGVKVFAGDKELNILEDRTFRSSVVDQITLVLPLEFRTQNSVEIKLVGSTGLESPTISIPLTLTTK